MTQLTQIHCKNAEKFTEQSVETVTRYIQHTLTYRDECILCLSGGSTPRLIYAALGKREDIDWQNVRMFLCDERYVPANHQDSNQKMIEETFAVDKNILFFDTTLPLEASMEDYAKKVKALWEHHLTDLAILGMGPDGHTASLFPPLVDSALGDKQLILHTTTDQFAVHDRMTLSLNALAASGHCIILLTGEEKKHMWKEMLASKENERRWPVKRILESSDVTLITDWGKE
ncbi:6-phosphogluconolactonase [Candidatus Peregrinibacteria bacterium CG10_big_fil_rev_8_21_14_0_10_49_16]|nr:MAG: 6-phosphogluconolactonase [Candidatus Peregrinibacteria bacterium CG22_combo_CG10-13_8_21_14_all_49_11]PIR52096.1 MAG: 6-phosphogluconolactonase [Candidatus Peregrinibacteria bacterium CG10_big_fil_rev_8_21_14_0_10_49_16]